MKTKPMDHQKIGKQLLRDNPEFYGLGCEQGTGKTWMFLADSEAAFLDKQIKGLFVLAPKGVHTNWIRREIPKHLDVPCVMEFYQSGMGVKKQRSMQHLLRHDDPSVLPVLAMNIDAVNTPKGFALAQEFLQTFDCMFTLDESSRIKNPQAKRTKKIIELGELAVSRRIGSGTLVPQSPMDLFSQFEFLAPRQGLLGTTSYRAFVAEFSELLPENHGIMRHAMERQAQKYLPGLLRKGWSHEAAHRKAMELASKYQPQMVAKDASGRPIYRNLEKLREMIAPYIYRVLKKDCLDLPPKVYQTYTFQLPPSQKKVYDTLKNELRYYINQEEFDSMSAIAAQMKIRQVVSGYILDWEGKVEKLTDAKDNPRMQLFCDLVEDVEGQFIVWAHFREEIEQIAQALKEMGISAVQYHGGVGNADREIAVDEFQSGAARVFVGQPKAGGIGLTLTAATTAIYYSRDWNLEDRLQSEDRCHRIGTTETVTYIDLAAQDTIDEDIAEALQAKQEVASAILDGV